MNKLYVILGFKAGISGGQIYVRNKIVYLKNHGWDVSVIDHVSDQKVYIDDLKCYENNIVKELINAPGFFSHKNRNLILEKLIEFSGYNNSYDEVVVESNTVPYSLWGELLAEKLKAKHIVLLIDAFFTDNTRRGGRVEFIDFKHKRKEVAGINAASLSDYFYGYKDLLKEDKYWLPFTCSNSVEDVDFPDIDVSEYDYVIGSLGRLNKPYVPDMIDYIVKFAKKHKDIKILLLVLGGQASGDESVVRDRTENICNLDVIITGLMYPFPRKLIHYLDVNIASSGSANVTAKEGIKTILLLDTSAEPFGVIGYSLNKIPFRDNRAYFGKLDELLEEVLINGYCDNFQYVNVYEKNNYFDIDIVMKMHIDFLIKSYDSSSVYYNTCKVYDKREKLVFVISNIFGRKFINQCFSIYRKIRGID